MIIDKGNKWQYTTDKLYIGAKLVKEVYIGTKKVYPAGVNLMRLREIVEDDARAYGDTGGIKYNWYVWFPNANGYDNFNDGQHVLITRIFCDYHPPHNGKYYGKDLSDPVGFANYGDTSKQKDPDTGVEYEIPQMRIIYFYASTASKYEVDGGSWLYPYTIPVNPDWKQGDGEGKYHTPGDSLIWTGWVWWIRQDDNHIFKYDFVKREFGPELTGADLWVPVDPYDPDS